MRLYRQTFYLYRIVSYRKTEIWKTVDWLTIILYVVLVVAGWFSICGASYEFDNVGLFDPSGRPGSQLMWMGLSVGLIFVLLMLESEFFDVFAYLIYAGFIVLLIATIFLAPNIKGSHSWLVLGPVRLQPAEFAKFATALAVAKLMNTYGFKLTVPKNFIAVLSLIFLPMICILLQQETGSALVYLAFFLMLYREGMSGYILLSGVCVVVFFVTQHEVFGCDGGRYGGGRVACLFSDPVDHGYPDTDRKERYPCNTGDIGDCGCCLFRRVCRFFLYAGRLFPDIDRGDLAGCLLSGFSFYPQLGVALCVDRSLCIGIIGFYVFGGLCVYRYPGTASTDTYQGFIGIGR